MGDVRFRLVGLLGALSQVTDLGTGAPLEESLSRKEAFRTFVPGMAEWTGASRARMFAALVLDAREGARPYVATCEVARDAARRLGLPERVHASLFHHGLVERPGVSGDRR